MLVFKVSCSGDVGGNEECRGGDDDEDGSDGDGGEEEDCTGTGTGFGNGNDDACNMRSSKDSQKRAVLVPSRRNKAASKMRFHVFTGVVVGAVPVAVCGAAILAVTRSIHAHICTGVAIPSDDDNDGLVLSACAFV
jgi:hypothetical protein